MDSAASEQPQTLRSPLTAALLVALSVFVAETLVMLALRRRPPFSLWAEALLDSTFLTLLLAPFLYALIHRPLVLHIRTHERAEAELRRAGEELEARVRERTSDLSLANESLQTQIEVRGRVEEALRASEERLELALWGADLGIWDWNVETGEVVRNERWAQMLGYSLREVEGQIGTWEKLIHPDDRPRVVEAVRANLEGRTPFYRTEHRLRAKSGEWRWVLDTGKVVERGSDGRPLRVTGTHLDITEAKKTEEALQRAQRLESLGVLAGGVAHDFNNLLGVIVGRASLALAKLPPEAPARANVEKAIQAAERAAELTAKMLAFSGRGHFVVGPMDLSALVREHRSLLEAAITKTIRLDLDLADGLPSIEADAGQVRQALLNLVLNASEAIGERAGTVRIATTRRQVSPADEAFWRHTGPPLAPGTYVSLEVGDDGCGMEEAAVGRIFDPFFTTKFTGRGLGLAAVLGVVRGHRGGIAVQSEVGRGTRLELVFPEAPPAALEEPGPAPASPGSTVLVVDDEEMMREAAVEMLEGQGFSVLAAAGGAEAVRLLRERRREIGIVLLDLSMPGMDGEETYRRLREIEPSLRIVLSSGFTEAEATRRFPERGLAGFLQKPYTLEALATIVRNCLGAVGGVEHSEESRWRPS